MSPEDTQVGEDMPVGAAIDQWSEDLACGHMTPTEMIDACNRRLVKVTEDEGKLRYAIGTLLEDLATLSR